MLVWGQERAHLLGAYRGLVVVLLEVQGLVVVFFVEAPMSLTKNPISTDTPVQVCRKVVLQEFPIVMPNATLILRVKALYFFLVDSKVLSPNWESRNLLTFPHIQQFSLSVDEFVV